MQTITIRIDLDDDVDSPQFVDALYALVVRGQTDRIDQLKEQSYKVVMEVAGNPEGYEPNDSCI